MKHTLKLAASVVALIASATFAHAEGELNIFNWGNYTNPELIKKFEEKFKVKVTLTDYVSNDTALAKIRQGGIDTEAPLLNYRMHWLAQLVPLVPGRGQGSVIASIR